MFPNIKKCLYLKGFHYNYLLSAFPPITTINILKFFKKNLNVFCALSIL